MGTKYGQDPTVIIKDPKTIIQKVGTSLIYENDFIVTYNFTVTFDKPVKKTTMMAIYWDEFVNSNTNYFVDALRVDN